MIALLGILSIATGIFILYSINKSKFYRRNSSGLETFSSYESAVATGCFERIARLTAFGLIIAGIIMMAA